MRRAFRTQAAGITSIVFAESAGKARYATFMAAYDAGWSVKLIDVKVLRASHMDHLESGQPDGPLSPELLGEEP